MKTIKELRAFISSSIEEQLKDWENYNAVQSAYTEDYFLGQQDFNNLLLKAGNKPIEAGTQISKAKAEEDIVKAVYSIYKDYIFQIFYDFVEDGELYLEVLTICNIICENAIGNVEEKKSIKNISAYIHELNKWVLMLITERFTEEKKRRVYSLISNGIVRIKNHFLFDEIEWEYGSMRSIKELWLEHFNNIKSNIESDIIAFGNETLNGQWYLDLPSFRIANDENNFNEVFRPNHFNEILLSHPKTNSEKDSEIFIKKYLLKKSTELKKPWIATLLSSSEITKKGKAGYYNTLGAFFHIAVSIKLIKPMDGEKFKQCLSFFYKNNLSRKDELQPDFLIKYKANLHGTLGKYFEDFDDMKKLFHDIAFLRS